MNNRFNLQAASTIGLIAALTACGGGGGDGGPAQRHVDVVAIGLIGNGLSLTLGTETIVVPANATQEAFAGTVAQGSAYAVSIATQPTGLTCSLANGVGTAGAADVSVQVACAPNTYALGGSVAGLDAAGLTLTNGAESLAVPPQVGTFAFAFTTPVAYGAPYAIAVSAQPAGQTCQVADGNGTMAAAAATNVAITCSDNRYAIGGSVTGLTGSGLVLRNGTQSVAVESGATSFAFAAGATAGTTYAVTIGTQPAGQTCGVTAGTDTGTTGDSDISSVAVTCRNYVVIAEDSYNDAIETFAIDSQGNVAGAPSATVAVGTMASSASGLALSADGLRAYATGNGVQQFSIGAAGNLTALPEVPPNGGGTASTIAVTPDGHFAYVADNWGNSVYALKVGADGALAATGAQYGYPTPGPYDVKTSADSRFLYTVNSPGTVSQFAIGTDGGLTPLASAQVAAGAGARTITLSPDGRFAYVANATDGTIGQYAVDAGGALHPLATATVAAGVAPWRTILSPDGHNLYCVNYSFTSPSVSQFAVGADGSLTALAPGPVTDGYPSALAFSPDGAWFYVSNMDGRFYRFARAVDGSLTLADEVNEGTTYKLWRIEVR